MTTENEEIQCERCNSIVPLNDSYYVESENITICNDCLNDNYSSCNRCGNITNDNDITESLCPSCFEETFFSCENCGDNARRDECYIVEDSMICNSCFENDVTYCEDCQHDFFSSHYNNPNYHDCINHNPIRDYSYKPDPQYFGEDSKVYYGVELEVESEDSPSKDAEHLEKFNDFIYCKHDGSLNSGFEIVSHPATLKYHKEYEWKEICGILLKRKAKSHDTSTCGLHVHISRKGFSDDKHLKKFILFWYSQNRIIKSISRRDFGHYCRDKSMGSGIIPPDEVLHSDTRYEQINLQNYNTVEVRRFRGTLNYVTLLACIELCDASRVYTDTVTYKSLRDTKLAEADFVSWLFAHKNQYPSLVEKLKSKMKIEFDSERE